MPEPIRVLLVDSPTLVRRCLAAVLGRRRRLAIVAEAGSGPEALAGSRSIRPDVVLVDPQVPEGGLQLVAELCAETPTGAVVVLTAETREGTVARVLEHGARGYLDKHCDVEDVARCIERVHAGEVVIAQNLARSLPGDFSAFRGSDSPAVSRRELEVLQLVAGGRTNQAIAHELFITEHTVKSHLAKMLGKLGLNNRVQLATYAAQHGVSPAPPQA